MMMELHGWSQRRIIGLSARCPLGAPDVRSNRKQTPGHIEEGATTMRRRPLLIGLATLGATGLVACDQIEVRIGAEPTATLPPPPTASPLPPPTAVPTVPPPPPTAIPTAPPAVAAPAGIAEPISGLRPTSVASVIPAGTPADTTTGSLFPPGIVKIPSDIGMPTSTATATRAPAASATPSPAPTRTAQPPTPTARASGPKVILVDDFTNPGSGFATNSTSDVARYSYNNGYFAIQMLKFTGTNAQSSWAISPRSSPILTDFVVTIDCQLEQALQDGAYSLLFRFVDFDNYYKFSVDPNTLYYTLFRLTKNVQTKLVDWKQSNAIKKGAGKNTLGILARGRELAAYINGELVGSATDAGFPSGKLALMANAWHDPFTVRFSNLLVTEPPQ